MYCKPLLSSLYCSTRAIAVFAILSASFTVSAQPSPGPEIIQDTVDLEHNLESACVLKRVRRRILLEQCYFE